MRFKTGQEVVCSNSKGWSYEKIYFDFFGIRIKKLIPSNGPKENEIVTIAGYSDLYHVFLNEYHFQVNGGRAAFDERGFEPVVPSETIEELINSLQEQL